MSGSSPVDAGDAPPHFFYGWVIVAGAFTVLFTAYGAQYAFGVFIPPLTEEFGWSRGAIGGVFSLYTAVYCLCGVVAGRLTDRFGPRIVIAGGGVLLGAGLGGMSVVGELWQPYVLYGVVAALGMSTAYVPCNATVVKWFVERRGLAVGIASSGGGLGTVILPPLAHLLVETLGWRAAFVALGGLALVVLAGVAVFLERDPEKLGLFPDGVPPRFDPAGIVERRAYTPSEAIRSGAFWVLALVFVSAWMPVFIPLVHAVPLARDLGISPFLASTVVSVIGGAAIVGRLALGHASDRIGRRAAVAIGIGLEAVAFGGLAAASDLVPLYVAAAVFGFAYGSVSTLFPAIVGDYFGRLHAASIVGLLFALAGSTAAVGPVLAGILYDQSGGYATVFVLSAASSLVALALLAVSRPPR